MLFIFLLSFFINIIFSSFIYLALLGETDMFVNNHINYYNIKEYLNSNQIEGANSTTSNNLNNFSLFLIMNSNYYSFLIKL